jgi:hypothetical protein
MSDYNEDPGEGSSRAPRADLRTMSAEAAPTPGRPPKLGANIASVSYLDEKIDRSRDQFRHGIEEINTSLAAVNRRLDQFDKMSNDMAEIKTFMATLMRERPTTRTVKRGLRRLPARVTLATFYLVRIMILVNKLLASRKLPSSEILQTEGTYPLGHMCRTRQDGIR